MKKIVVTTHEENVNNLLYRVQQSKQFKKDTAARQKQRRSPIEALLGIGD